MSERPEILQSTDYLLNQKIHFLDNENIVTTNAFVKAIGFKIHSHNSFSIHLVNVGESNTLSYKVLAYYDTNKNVPHTLVEETDILPEADVLIEKNCTGRQIEVLVKSKVSETPTNAKVYVRLNPNPLNIV